MLLSLGGQYSKGRRTATSRRIQERPNAFLSRRDRRLSDRFMLAGRRQKVTCCDVSDGRQLLSVRIRIFVSIAFIKSRSNCNLLLLFMVSPKLTLDAILACEG
jgi:hypothetical protein